MGFFNRLTDFGDREMVRTYAMRVGTGLQQLQETNDLNMLQGLSQAIAQDVQNMLIQAAKLTPESMNCLNVSYKGRKIPYMSFLDEIRKFSAIVVQRGGYPLI
jgi:hypothetical protein